MEEGRAEEIGDEQACENRLLQRHVFSIPCSPRRYQSSSNVIKKQTAKKRQATHDVDRQMAAFRSSVSSASSETPKAQSLRWSTFT